MNSGIRFQTYQTMNQPITTVLAQSNHDERETSEILSTVKFELRTFCY